MKFRKYTKITFPILVTLCIFFTFACESNTDQSSANSQEADSLLQNKRMLQALKTGPEILFDQHLDQLTGKNLAIVANHTSIFRNGKHLVDSLMDRGMKVSKVFAPEHGFRGTADAGEAVASGKDKKTGLPIISLYGKNKKPTQAQVKGLDLVIFDIQDVGSRHYTYIGTMTYVMEACAEAGIPFMVLDRPNPNGWYVDGPVLSAENHSFIGMHEIPIVHGMSIGEYAQMVNGEKWMKGGVEVALQVIPCQAYTHDMDWEATGLDWVAPSPNLGKEYYAYLYPALCWLEPTPVSLGRGTHDAFGMLGAPWFKGASKEIYGLQADAFEFTPVSLPGKSKYPKFQDELCKGLKFSGRVDGKALFLAGLTLIQDLYKQSPSKAKFFKKGFHKWPGNKTLQKQIESGVSPEDIYQSWQEGVEAFREIRQKYLLYPESGKNMPLADGNNGQIIS